MTYIKFGSNADFETINSKIHNLFGELPNIDFNVNFQFKPKADYYIDNENIFIELEIPGVKKDELKITFKENVLNISGQKKNRNKNLQNIETLKSERNYGDFSRSFQIDDEINPDSFNAEFEDGVLKISVKKAIKQNNSEKEIKIK